MSRSTEGNWVPGMKCTKCHGTGESEDARTCSACAGTGGVWMKWRQRAETAEKRVAELEAQNARLRAALEELKRNTVEVILPNAKCLTLDLGQLALWDACVRQVDEALADGKAAPS